MFLSARCDADHIRRIPGSQDRVLDLPDVVQMDAVRVHHIVVKIQTKQICALWADIITNILPISKICTYDILDLTSGCHLAHTDRTCAVDWMFCIFFDCDLGYNIVALTVPGVVLYCIGSPHIPLQSLHDPVSILTFFILSPQSFHETGSYI